MPRAVLALACSTLTMPALAADLFSSESLGGMVQTIAFSFDLDTTSSDADGLTATIFAEMPLAVSSLADTTAGTGSGSATLQSFRAMNSVEAHGSALASAFSTSDGGAGSDAIVQFSFAFVLTAGADYALDWDLASGGMLVPGTAMITLSGPGGLVFSQPMDTFGSMSGTASGTLPSGAYTLYAMAQASASAGASGADGNDASFGLVFSVVPAPGALGLLSLSMLAAPRRRR
ncbi:MAG: hypothetical protein KF912_04485 [Phycisphaeraceae bacterium]|nr:hypothetical protein [Phycisphaeraceae bacterium]MBX3366555.1 hypothetical protein [Phycisphaeraceae bacterium]